MEYKTYSVLPFEEQPGRWFAKIQRLDGRLIKRVGDDSAKESITTPAARYSADDVMAFAKEAIDGGGGFDMRTAGCWEPYESRGSRTVL